ncbi:MAG: ABC transporter substrate-binding protein [Oscillospiraceae bacterium]|nr:ABC transporter substrate-binding protein [Oscillospiraceae bacterium]
MTRKILSFLLSILLLTTAAGCSRSGEAVLGEVFYSFTDDMGREVTLPERPETVAVLFSSFAEVWTLAGGEVAVTVGESVERGFADADAVLVDDGAGKTINMELLLQAQPDFVICSADIEAQMKAAELLCAAAVPVACFRVETFADYLRMLRVCTEITGDAAAYETHGAAVAARIETLLADAGEGAADILFIRAGSSASATKAKTAGQHFAAAMLEELGAHNIADAAPVLLDGLSMEEVLRADPDFIFISTMGKESAAKAHMETVLAEPAWQSLSAVKNGRVIYLPKELFQFKPNARWGDAYAYLIEVLYGA